MKGVEQQSEWMDKVWPVTVNTAIDAARPIHFEPMECIDVLYDN